MYPFKTGQLYPANQWYVAAWSSEITHELTARTILGTRLVLYRTEAGAPVALADRCPHRGYPLSKSCLMGDVIQCGYHGFEFDSSGQCVSIPSQARVPASMGVRAYPLHESWEWVWIWMGDPAFADTSTIPDPVDLKLQAPGWVAAAGNLERLNCRYQMLNENLLDLSHLSYIHGNTIGDAEVAKAEVQVTETPQFLELARYAKSGDMSLLANAKVLGLEGLIDRTMIQRFYPPSFHVIAGDYDSAQKGGVEPGLHFGSARFLHAVTPETPTTTLYFWAFARDFRLDPEVTEAFKRVVQSAIAEDIDALEAIEIWRGRDDDNSDEISARADNGGLRGRLLVRRQIEREAAGLAQPPETQREEAFNRAEVVQ